MKLGLHISDFTWDGGAPGLRLKLGEIAQRAEQGGVDRISVMDHLWQIGHIGPPEHAILGIGAAWNADESAGLGLLFPPVAERFERLEEAILICKQMWSGDEAPFDGKHYHLARTLNSPQALSRPHPPILIGGGGEKKTLKLVARYADACNIQAYNLEDTAHKLDVLRQHCANEGRDYDEIEKTAQTRYDLGENGENVNKTIENLHQVAELGFAQVHGSLLGVSKPGQLDLLAEQVIPAVAKF
jgi:alkanesulfonate monooxygenase SsuD/methylene tetrahydromethanopterin reductase-like flavin-dependent oxidoreductase (luciferase family)